MEIEETERGEFEKSSETGKLVKVVSMLLEEQKVCYNSIDDRLGPKALALVQKLAAKYSAIKRLWVPEDNHFSMASVVAYYQIPGEYVEGAREFVEKPKNNIHKFIENYDGV